MTKYTPQHEQKDISRRAEKINSWVEHLRWLGIKVEEPATGK